MSRERPLSILLAGDYPADPRLGSAKVFYKLREEFEALGHHCDVVFTGDIAGPAGRQLRQLVTPWSAGRAIARKAAATRYDVFDVASAEGLGVGVAKRLGRYRGTAYICRSNGLEQLNYQRMLDDHTAGLTSKPWTRRWWYPASRLSQVAAAARSADRLLLLNEMDRAYACSRHWQPDDRIDLVPHGVSERFLTATVDEQERRGLLFCGSWSHMKGTPYLVRAFEGLHAAGCRVPLTILGPGVDANVVLADFAPDVRPHVLVRPRVSEDEVIDAYRRHALLLWTSTYEGFGLVLIEAMSQGLPAVTTPVGCAATVVRDGENGVIVAPRDPAAIAAATIDLLADPARLRRLGGAARRAVRSMSWRVTAEQTIGVYRQALAQL